VLGHTKCGAVAAAIETRLRGTRQHSRIQLLVECILPGLEDLDPQLTPEAMLAQAVEANVRWASGAPLRQRPIIFAAIRVGGRRTLAALLMTLGMISSFLFLL
jgi:carbonic anhydrase